MDKNWIQEFVQNLSEQKRFQVSNQGIQTMPKHLLWLQKQVKLNLSSSILTCISKTGSWKEFLCKVDWSQHTVFPRKLFYFEFGLMYCDLCSQYIKVRKLFKGGNYSRAGTILGNTVIGQLNLAINFTWSVTFSDSVLSKTIT